MLNTPGFYWFFIRTTLILQFSDLWNSQHILIEMPKEKRFFFLLDCGFSLRQKSLIGFLIKCLSLTLCTWHLENVNSFGFWHSGSNFHMKFNFYLLIKMFDVSVICQFIVYWLDFCVCDDLIVKTSELSVTLYCLAKKKEI